MKEQGLYVEKMNEVPQVRETVPGYLVRSGSTSALDADFGKDTGAGAVLLLLKGISGVTITCLYEGNIEYIPTEIAIKITHEFRNKTNKRIIEKADLVTEMREIKHYYSQGIQAREGIEK